MEKTTVHLKNSEKVLSQNSELSEKAQLIVEMNPQKSKQAGRQSIETVLQVFGSNCLAKTRQRSREKL